jgi:hypothetical protein
MACSGTADVESILYAKAVQSLQDSRHLFMVEVAAVTPELLTEVYTELEYRFNVFWVVNEFCIELQCFIVIFQRAMCRVAFIVKS